MVHREPVSPLGRFPDCIRTGSRNFEAANSEVFMHGIYIRQQPVNGGHHDRNVFVVCLGFMIKEMEYKYTIYTTKREQRVGLRD